MAPHTKPALRSTDLTTAQSGDVQRRLTQCLNVDASHIVPGSNGPEVKAIQDALKKIRLALPALGLPDITDPPGNFGDSTAAAVLAYKDGHNVAGDRIVRQGAPLDDIVGRMTLAQIDDDLLTLPKPKPKPAPPPPPPVVSMKANVFIGHMGRLERESHVIVEYYKFCGLETIGPARIETAAINRFRTFEGLIEQLIASDTFQNVVVNHGDVASGMLIRLCHETQFRATGFVILALKELADRREKGALNFKDPDTKFFAHTVTSNAQIPRAVAERIVDKLVALRQKPRVVHLRACNQKTPDMARRYAQAFGTITLSFHSPRLLYWKFDPGLPQRQGDSAAAYFKRHTSTGETRYRLFQDPFGEIADMVIGVGVQLDEKGDVAREDSIQGIDRRTPADLDGWMQAIIQRWSVSTAKGFVVPLMWTDPDFNVNPTDASNLSWDLPLESGWRDALQFV